MSKIQQHRDAASDCLKRAAGVKSDGAREELFKIARSHLEYIRTEEEREKAARQK
jgi:hypothetical protein